MACELIIGGARSGKSREAERRATQDGREVAVVATAQALDAEMAQRIARHRAERPAHWRSIEAPRRLAQTLQCEAREDRVLIVDCLTLWLSNSLLAAGAQRGDFRVERLAGYREERDALLDCLPGLPGRVLLVSNEVALSLVPESALGRLFRDEAGRVNQRVAALAARVSLVVAGIALELKGG